MKRKIFILTVLFLFIMNFTYAAIWDFKKFYSKMTVNKFFKAKQPKQFIKFMSVHEELLGTVIFFEVNRVRMKKGLKPFKYSRMMQLAALEHAQSLALLEFKTNPNARVDTYRQCVKKFTITRNSIFKVNAVTVQGLNVRHGLRVVPPDRLSGVYKLTNGQIAYPFRYNQLAGYAVGIMLRNRKTRNNILSRSMKVIGSSGAIYFKNKIPLFKIVVGFANYITDEMYTGDR